MLDDDPIYAWNLTEDLRDNNEFECPVCGDRMVGVLPNEDIIKYFRHFEGSAHKPESPEHIMMKKIIFDKITDLGYDVVLEKIIEGEPNLRIADVVIEDRGVVECQCSSISESEFDSRRRFYKSYGFKDTWIFGGYYYSKASENKKDKKRGFEYNIIQKVPRTVLKDLDKGLYYYNNNVQHFYKTDFNFKKKRGSKSLCKTVGWYDFKRKDLVSILVDEDVLDLKGDFY